MTGFSSFFLYSFSVNPGIGVEYPTGGGGAPYGYCPVGGGGAP